MKLRCAVGLCALAISGTAYAEDVARPPEAAADEIVVTGEKTNRTLQDTPASVAVTTNETITNQNLLSVYDVLERTPNLSVNGTRTSFSIRGIDAVNVSGGGDGALASIYLDGAVLPRATLTVGPLDLYDISQVEVFRGPQSTVQGRNALAGAVIVRTTDPTYDWTGRARLMLTGRSGERRAGAAVGGPIVDGQVAFRLSGEVARSDGLIYNQTLRADGDRPASETIRGKLLLTPDALPGLRIVATFMHDRHKRGTFYSEFDAPFDRKARIATEDVQDSQTVKSDIGTIEIGYTISDRFSINATTNYSDVRYNSIADADRSAEAGQVSTVTDPDKTFQQEVRFNFDLGWVQGLVGAYYLSDDNRDYYFKASQNLGLRRLGVDRTLLAMGLPQSTVDAVINLYYGGTVPIQNSLARPRLTTNHAGFTDLTFPIIGRLKFRAGLRYDHESQERGATQTVVIMKDLPNPAALPIPALAPIVTQLNALLRATATGANSIEPVRTVTYQAWLPKAGLTWDLTRDIALSATAQRGYRAGGSGLNQQRAQGYTFEPEYTWNYELALRSDWFNRRLTVNANAYWIDWKDQQVSVQLTPGAAFDTQILNAGKSRLYGFELDVRGRPTRTLSLYGGLGYSNTRFKEFNVSIGQIFLGVAGNEFANAPRWTASAGATWQHPNGLIANINANYRSAYYQSTQVQTFRDIPARTIVNTRIGWQNDHVGAYLFVSNLFNVQKPVYSFVDFDGRTRGLLSDPRMAGISFEGRF